MTDFIKEIANETEFDQSLLQGYSATEIEKMESFYDIKISGDLRKFLCEAGRCSGQIRLVDLVFYHGYYSLKRPSMISGHVANQIYFRDEIMKYGRSFSTGKPFLFAIENETQYYFLRTRADEPLRGVTPEDEYYMLSTDPEIVYHFDENIASVRNTEMTFKEYLISRVVVDHSAKIGMGEMISF